MVTLGAAPSAGSAISGRNLADRFLMGLLRALADAVLIGAGTLRGSPGHRWTPEHVAQDYAASFRELRLTLGRKAEPRLVVLTASGDLDVGHQAVVDGATIVTTAEGANRLKGRLSLACDVIEVGDRGGVDLRRALDALRDLGYAAILTEGGPHVMGDLIANDLLDEAFLTISPVVAGQAGPSRFGMVAGIDLLPARAVWTQLLSVRRHGDFMFLRYGLRGA